MFGAEVSLLGFGFGGRRLRPFFVLDLMVLDRRLRLQVQGLRFRVSGLSGYRESADMGLRLLA